MWAGEGVLTQAEGADCVKLQQREEQGAFKEPRGIQRG